MKIKNTDTVLVVSKEGEMRFCLPKNKLDDNMTPIELTFAAMFMLLQEREPKFIKIIEKKIAEIEKEVE